MKLNITRFPETYDLTIKGDENWLENIYSYFPIPEDTKKPVVVGQISIRKMDGDFLEIKGSIKYEPFIDCSRCGIKISWPIEDSFSLYYQSDEFQNTDQKVMDLKKSELEEYFIEGDELDIEQMINERIQLSIPPRIVIPRADKPDECLVCGDNLEDSRVYGVRPEDDPTNPFQALKKIKKPN